MRIREQDIITQNIKSLSSLPHSLILCGEYGCGKHTLCQDISDEFNLEIVDITEHLSYDEISNLYLCPIDKLYIVDADRITVKEQNSILKLLEDTPDTAYVVLLCKDKYSLLSTILNRCQIWEFKPYSKEFLMEFVDEIEFCGTDEFFALNFATTPGQVLTLSNYNLNNMINLCESVYTKIDRASIANTFVISDKINWKDDSSKFNLEMFLRCMSFCCCDMCKKDSKYFTAYYLTQELIKDISTPNAIKQRVFERFLLRLKDCMKNAG